MLVQVYGDNDMKITEVYKWVTRFFWGKKKCHWRREIRTASNQKIEENIAKFRQIVRQNTLLTLSSIAEKVNIDRETVMKILIEDLDMRKVCAKMVPKELTEGQKQISVFSY